MNKSLPSDKSIVEGNTLRTSCCTKGKIHHVATEIDISALSQHLRTDTKFRIRRKGSLQSNGSLINKVGVTFLQQDQAWGECMEMVIFSIITQGQIVPH